MCGMWIVLVTTCLNGFHSRRPPLTSHAPPFFFADMDPLKFGPLGVDIDNFASRQVV